MAALQLTCALLAALAVALQASAAVRSHSARAEFQRAVPCPATGQRRGGCPGYVVDHVLPLACGGDDRPSNMQWQTVADAKAKDREELKLCRKAH